jgi:transcription elongation factor GreB
MAGPNFITPAGLLRIQRELEWLQKRERPRIAREVGHAASLGDRSENAEYIYGKKRLREIERRMHHLMHRLDNVHVIDPAKQRGPRVVFGATVTIADEKGEEKTWTIYGEDEVDTDHGVLSLMSPLARALIGKSEGDTVKFLAPGGTREVEIVAVRYDPQPEEPNPFGDSDEPEAGEGSADRDDE